MTTKERRLELHHRVVLSGLRAMEWSKVSRATVFKVWALLAPKKETTQMARSSYYIHPESPAGKKLQDIQEEILGINMNTRLTPQEQNASIYRRLEAAYLLGQGSCSHDDKAMGGFHDD